MIDFSTEEWPTPLPPNSAEREARVSEGQRQQDQPSTSPGQLNGPALATQQQLQQQNISANHQSVPPPTQSNFRNDNAGPNVSVQPGPYNNYPPQAQQMRMAGQYHPTALAGQHQQFHHAQFGMPIPQEVVARQTYNQQHQYFQPIHYVPHHPPPTQNTVPASDVNLQNMMSEIKNDIMGAIKEAFTDPGALPAESETDAGGQDGCSVKVPRGKKAKLLAEKRAARQKRIEDVEKTRQLLPAEIRDQIAKTVADCAIALGQIEGADQAAIFEEAGFHRWYMDEFEGPGMRKGKLNAFHVYRTQRWREPEMQIPKIKDKKARAKALCEKQAQIKADYDRIVSQDPVRLAQLEAEAIILTRKRVEQYRPKPYDGEDVNEPLWNASNVRHIRNNNISRFKSDTLKWCKLLEKQGCEVVVLFADNRDSNRAQTFGTDIGQAFAERYLTPLQCDAYGLDGFSRNCTLETYRSLIADAINFDAVELLKTSIHALRASILRPLMIGEQAENKLFDLTHPSYQRDRGCVGTLTDELQEKVNELAAQQRKRALDSGGLHTLVEKYNCPTTAYAASKSKAPKNISNAKTKGANTLSTAQHKDGESTHGNVTPTTEVTSQPQQPPFLPTQPSLQVQAALPNTSPDTNNNTADALLNGSSPSGLPLAGHSAQTTNVGGGLSHPTPPPTSPTVQLNSTAEPQTPTPHSRKRRRLDPFSNEDPSSSPPAQPALFVTPTHRNHARVIASDIPIAEDSRTKAKRLYGQLLGLYTTVVPTWRKTTFPKLYEIERVLEAINKTWRHPSTATPLEFCGHHSKWGRALTEKIDIAIRNGEISIVDHMSAVPQ